MEKKKQKRKEASKKKATAYRLEYFISLV